MSRPVLMLIDGHALTFRAFHALSDAGLRSSRGEPTYAVYGFVSIMLNAIHEHHPEYLAVAFDKGPTFRDELYAEYKAGRAETPAEFEPQLERIKDVLNAFNIPIFALEKVEADDTIGTLARHATAQGIDTLILTGDTDTLQLVDEHVRVVLANPFGQKMSTKVYDLAAVLERYKGLRPDQLADLRGLKGDASDNIPGVKGIGEAGAIALLNQFGTVEKIYANFAEVPKRYQKPLDGQEGEALFSKRLATIKCDVEDAILNLDAARLRDYDRTAVIALFQELEFGATLVKRLPTTTGSVELASIPATSGPVQADMFTAPAPPPAIDAGGGNQQLTMFEMPSTAPVPAPGATAQLGEYRAVVTEDDLAELLADLNAAAGFAFDTETTGLRPLQDTMIGISFATRAGQAWYLPLRHQQAQQLPLEMALDAVRPFFADPGKARYAHNAKFDIEVLEHAGVPVASVEFDTLIAATLLDKRRGLKELAFYELKLPEPMTAIDELIGKGKKQITFDAVPIEAATAYAAADSDMTLRLVQALEPQLRALPEIADVFYKIEMPLIPVLTHMEQAGIGLDADYMRGLGVRMGERLAEAEQQIYTIAERPFNINSGDQLSDVLFGKMGLPTTGLAKTSTGRYSLTADVLEGLRQHDSSGILELILQYRQLSKLKSTYVDALPQLVNPTTGRVHTTYSQIGAATGRLSSNDPNLQNIPTRTDEGREVRRGFVAAPGQCFIAADYSQIELRVLAHLTQDSALMQAFAEGQDIHAATASRLFGVGIHGVSKNQRRVAKMTVFGVIYGISAFGLAQRTDLTRSEAQHMIDGLFASYPGLRSYFDETLARGRDWGYVQTLFGRRRVMADLRASGPRRAAAEREAVNAPIQGTAADLMKMAMLRVDQTLRSSELQARMLLQVHDELIFEAPVDQAERLAALVKREMEDVYPLRVPLLAEVEVGGNWEEMKPLSSV